MTSEVWFEVLWKGRHGHAVRVAGFRIGSYEQIGEEKGSRLNNGY